MTSVIVHAPKDVRVVEEPRRPLAPSECRIASSCSLLSSGTERLAVLGTFPPSSHWAEWIRYPFRPGYASIGKTTEVGRDISKTMIQTRMALRAAHASEHAIARDHCFPIPHRISDSDAVWFALSKIGFLGTYAAKANRKSTVLVVGGGPIGQMVIRWLAFRRIRAAYLLSPYDTHLQAGKEGGALLCLKGTTHDCPPVKAIGRLHHRPDIVIDCTNDPSVLEWSLSAVADYGRVVLVGDPPDLHERNLTADVLTRGIVVCGTHDRLTYGIWSEADLAMLFFRALSKGRLSVRGLITHAFAAADAVRAYDALLNTSGSLGVLLKWKES